MAFNFSKKWCANSYIFILFLAIISIFYSQLIHKEIFSLRRRKKNKNLMMLAVVGKSGGKSCLFSGDFDDILTP